MSSRSILLLALLSLLISPGIAQESSCEEGQVCSPETPVCGTASYCVTSTPFYQRGGSAQAYTPDAPRKSQVCDANLQSPYKAATWPFGRSSKRQAPQVTVNLHLYECSGSVLQNKDQWYAKNKDQCCCVPLADNDSIQIEVWQAKPNGRYSSLSSNDGICRATLEGTSFTTLAPGSTGILGGLGPGGWDLMPFGTPAIHMLFSSQDHQPLLLHVPVVLDRKLESRSFFGPDWRGPAHVTQKIREQKYAIEKWVVTDDGSIILDINVYLNAAAQGEPVDLSKTLCPSTLYGSPTSFFLEPIAVCARSMLDFFEL